MCLKMRHWVRPLVAVLILKNGGMPFHPAHHSFQDVHHRGAGGFNFVPLVFAPLAFLRLRSLQHVHGCEFFWVTHRVP